MNSERTSINIKVKQGHYKKRDTWNQGNNTKYKRGFEQRYGKHQKKHQTEILELICPFSQKKKKNLQCKVTQAD
jgi:hypothetical protein